MTHDARGFADMEVIVADDVAGSAISGVRVSQEGSEVNKSAVSDNGSDAVGSDYSGRVALSEIIQGKIKEDIELLVKAEDGAWVADDVFVDAYVEDLVPKLQGTAGSLVYRREVVDLNSPQGVDLLRECVARAVKACMQTLPKPSRRSLSSAPDSSESQGNLNGHAGKEKNGGVVTAKVLRRVVGGALFVKADDGTTYYVEAQKDLPAGVDLRSGRQVRILPVHLKRQTGTKPTAKLVLE